MLKINTIYFISLTLLSIIFSEEIMPEITSERKKLIVLGSENSDSKISKKITQIASSVATKLNRYEVLDRSQLERILNEQKKQHSGVIDQFQAVEIGKIAAANEALFIQINNFGQKGVPTPGELEKTANDEPETGLFGWLVKEVVKAEIDKKMEDIERYPNNIETIIDGEIRVLDVETGESLSSFRISAEYIGGAKTKSLNEALKSIRLQIENNLKLLYQLSTEVLDVNGDLIMLLLGSDMGIKKGILFEILTLNEKKIIRDREITIPGKQIGFIEVESVSEDISNGRILRKWESIKPGYQAKEINNGINSWSLSVKYANSSQNRRLRLSSDYNAFHRLGGTLFGDIGSVKDSRGASNFQFGFGFNMNYRLILAPSFSLGFLMSFPFDLSARYDDAKNYVSMPIFSPRLGMQSEVLLNSKIDLVISAEYILSTFSGKWTYTKNENDSDDSISKPGYWIDRAPEIYYSSFELSLGIRSHNVK